MDLYKCAYRDPRSPLTPIKPINTQYFQSDALKSTSNYNSTPLSSRVPDSTKAVALCDPPADSTRYYTLVPQRNVFSTTTQNCGKIVCKNVTEEVCYERGKVVKISRSDQRKEKIIFKKTSPHSKPLCPKVAEWLRSIGLQKFQNLFKDEEIDYKTLLLMDEHDLQYLGIRCPRERSLLLHLIRRKKDYWNF